MTHLARAAAMLLALSAFLVPGVMLANPAPALADCGMEAPPGSVSGYRGLAFIGTVARTERVDSAGYGTVSAITYRIERMLAGRPVSSMTVIEGLGVSCWYIDGRRLRVGDRVLISAATPLDRGGGHPYVSHELVWRSTGHGTWHFASGLYGEWLRYLPKAARSATTTRAIRALVAPGSEPDTSTSDATNRDCDLQALMPEPGTVRGNTFIGTVDRVSPGTPIEMAVTYRFDVERVFAGDVGDSVDLVGGVCNSIAFEVGVTYLVSWGGPIEGDRYLQDLDTAVWVVDGDRLAFQPEFPPLLDDYPGAFRDATTLSQVLDVVAPGLAPIATDEPGASAGPSASPWSAPTAVPTTDRFTTCGGHAYPGLGIDAPVGYGSIDEVQALEPALIRFREAFPGSSDWPWRLAGRDETGMLFLARTDAFGPPGWMSVEVSAGDRPGDASMGQCDPRIVPSPDLGAADWWLDPDAGPPHATSTELDVLVMEQACASGTSAGGRIAEPFIDYGPTTVTIIIGVRRGDGAQECPSNPPTPFVVRLTEPLGDRTLLDGGHAVPVVPTAPE